MKLFAFFLILAAGSFAFTIESYHNDVRVLDNGDIRVYEDITFNLESKYNEGFRTIRQEDAPSLNQVVVHSVKVNGEPIEAYAQTYQGNTEIVWKKTEAGINRVELEYTLKDRVEAWDDFARLCYEHFGAGWSASAKIFKARTTPPESAGGQEMHFEVYSERKGVAYVEDLSVVIEMDQVPPGNFIGGCYLFAKDSVNATRRMNGSALEILESEREEFGSEQVYSEAPLPFELCLVPLAIILSIAAAALFFRSRNRDRLPESILPPDDEDPIVVSAITRNSYPEKDMLGATILDLINRGVVDIIELEKKGEASAELKKERTVLTLKKTAPLELHEQAVIDMIFQGGKEADLDKVMNELAAISERSAASAHPAMKAFERFKDEVKKVVAGRKLVRHCDDHNTRLTLVVTFGFMLGVTAFIFSCFLIEAALYHFESGDNAAWLILASLPLIAVSLLLIGRSLIEPKAPKGMEEEFRKWDAFSRGLKASRIKEYPPGSVIIWGRILVYATALGLADKVKRHLSELDALTMERMDEMDRIRRKSAGFYVGALAVSNLSKYGNRSGYSSRSSGGWSSGGGGGFSGGSSGGGGFR